MKAFLTFKHLLIIHAFLFFLNIGCAQDIHWSQFNQNPIFQNPANAGNFNGDFRFVGNFRDQWRSVSVPFNTISISADSRFAKSNHIGYGLLLFHDVAGDGKFRTIELQGNLSYVFKLSADSLHCLRFGINFGFNHRQLNWDKFYFDNQFNGVQFDPGLPTNESFQTDRKTNVSVGSGLSYTFFKNSRNYWVANAALFNINQPNQGFYNQTIKRDIRYLLNFNGLYKIGLDLDVLPSINFTLQGKYRELCLGSSIKYTLVNRLGVYRAVYAGVWYRVLDANYFTVGVDYQNWFVGLSYDVNLSKLVPASNNRGGFEIAVRYILNKFKPKQTIHRACPDYI
jgi:type IX secretion system PorP/SprF family membrane protein